MDDQQVRPAVAIPLALLFAVAGGLLRFSHLGSMPLADAEALQAMAAHSLAAGIKPAAVTEGFYVSLTGLFFWLFGSGEAIARLVPAMAGWAFSLVPALFRRQLGDVASLVLLGLFAFDPSLIAVSRSVNDVVLPLLSTSLLVYALISERPRFAGFALAMAMLGGPMGWLSLAGLGLGLGAHSLFKQKPFAAIVVDHVKKQGLVILLSASISIVAFGGGLYIQPAMLDVPFNGLASIFSRFSLPTGPTMFLPGLGLVFYELFALVLGICGISLLSKNSARWFWLYAFSLFMFIATYFQPEQNTIALAWITPLLLVGGSMFVAEFLTVRPLFDRETLGMFIFSMVVLVFMGLNYLSAALAQVDPSVTQLRWTVMIGSFTMLAASLVLVTYGWSFSVAWRGLISALAVFLFAVNINAAWSVSHLRAGNTQELTDATTRITDGNVLKTQLEAVNAWNFGSGLNERVSVVGADSPALLWQLRDSSVKFLPGMSNPEDLGDIIITNPEMVDAQLEKAYRGQGFIWSNEVAYEALTVSDWLKWSVSRNFPVNEQRLILWIKADRFIDRQNNPE